MPFNTRVVPGARVAGCGGAQGMGRIRRNMFIREIKGSGRCGRRSGRNAIVTVRAVAAENQQVCVSLVVLCVDL